MTRTEVFPAVIATCFAGVCSTAAAETVTGGWELVEYHDWRPVGAWKVLTIATARSFENEEMTRAFFKQNTEDAD